MMRMHIFVSGVVQGVSFRRFTYENAVSLGINGWVKNRDDGRVEIIAEGEEHNLEKFLERIKKGPPLARVDNIEIKFEEPKNEKEFKIIR